MGMENAGVGDTDRARPDGRPVTTETGRLRDATRALRLHLDELPIDYHLDVPGDRFLTNLAFMFARQRFDCADSLIGAGFGGTILGSLARSLFVDGLRWLWIADRPERRRTLLGDLLTERNGICVLLEKTGASCPILPRWLMPLPDVADLTGQSMTWVDAPAMPDEHELLDGFFALADTTTTQGSGTVLGQVTSLLNIAGLRGAVMVLSHAGHGNYLGLQGSLAEGGAVGHDLRPEHEALFMHVAAVGASATLTGTAVTSPEDWPADVERASFISRAVALTADVAAAAAPIHRLGTRRRRAQTGGRAGPSQQRTQPLLRPPAILAADNLLPDINSVGPVAEAAENYFTAVRAFMVRAWDHGQPSLHTMLSYGGGHSDLMTVMSTYDQPGSEIIAVFAARNLLEEAARLVWRFSVTEQEFEERAKRYFDEFRHRRRKTINMLVGEGVARPDAERIFALPGSVRVGTPPDGIGVGRQPLPTITSMLREMGEPYPEPGWLEVAYSLLSQITHSTPIGHLHTVRFRDGDWHGNELSPEMLSLALDAACLGSAHLIGTAAVLLTDLDEKAWQYRRTLLHEAGKVHEAARFVHGLD